VKLLEDQIALVTGAAQNIGLAISKAFVDAGARVLMVDRQAELIEKEAAPFGDRAKAVAADMTDRAACAEVVAAAEAWGGRLDILVNNAYGAPWQSVVDQSDEGWDQGIAIGLTALMATSRAALPGMIERGSGNLITLGSTNAFIPCHGFAAYAAVKGGIVNFTRQIASEYGPHGVRANCLCPGFITNPKREEVYAEKPLERARVTSLIPLRRMGTDDEIGKAALFLASDLASFYTGQCLIVDGGQTIQNPKMGTWPFQEAIHEFGMD